jgi:hypothetical protein
MKLLNKLWQLNIFRSVIEWITFEIESKRKVKYR